jgi:hypothetical protein
LGTTHARVSLCVLNVEGQKVRARTHTYTHTRARSRVGGPGGCWHASSLPHGARAGGSQPHATHDRGPSPTNLWFSSNQALSAGKPPSQTLTRGSQGSLPLLDWAPANTRSTRRAWPRQHALASPTRQARQHALHSPTDTVHVAATTRAHLANTAQVAATTRVHLANTASPPMRASLANTQVASTRQAFANTRTLANPGRPAPSELAGFSSNPDVVTVWCPSRRVGTRRCQAVGSGHGHSHAHAHAHARTHACSTHLVLSNDPAVRRGGG